MQFSRGRCLKQGWLGETLEQVDDDHDDEYTMTVTMMMMARKTKI